MTPRRSNEVESARQARRSIGLIRQKLLNPTPEVLEACAPHLRTAIDALDHVQQVLAKPDSRSETSRTTLQIEMAQLRRELSQVNALLKNAARFYSGMARFLVPQVDESISYAASGAVMMRPQRTMVLEG